jgi:hypothetical protein
MPQLDFLVIQTESFILPSFFFYYFLFLKKIEPLLTFQLRIKKLLELEYYIWFDNNLNTFVEYDSILVKKTTDSLFYGKYYFEWLCFFLPEYRVVFPDRMYPMDLYYLQGIYYSAFDECNRNYFRVINY